MRIRQFAAATKGSVQAPLDLTPGNLSDSGGYARVRTHWKAEIVVELGARWTLGGRDMKSRRRFGRA